MGVSKFVGSAVGFFTPKPTIIECGHFSGLYCKCFLGALVKLLRCIDMNTQTSNC